MKHDDLRVRTRRLLEVGLPAGGVRWHTWALIPAVFGEEVGKHASGVRWDGPAYPMPRAIHGHQIEPMGVCTADCLLTDAVPAGLPVAANEVQVK